MGRPLADRSLGRVRAAEWILSHFVLGRGSVVHVAGSEPTSREKPFCRSATTARDSRTRQAMGAGMNKLKMLIWLILLFTLCVPAWATTTLRPHRASAGTTGYQGMSLAQGRTGDVIIVGVKSRSGAYYLASLEQGLYPFGYGRLSIFRHQRPISKASITHFPKRLIRLTSSFFGATR